MATPTRKDDSVYGEEIPKPRWNYRGDDNSTRGSHDEPLIANENSAGSATTPGVVSSTGGNAGYSAPRSSTAGRSGGASNSSSSSSNGAVDRDTLANMESSAQSGESSMMDSVEQRLNDKISAAKSTRSVGTGIMRNEGAGPMDRFKAKLKKNVKRRVAIWGTTGVIGFFGVFGLSMGQAIFQIKHVAEILKKPMSSQDDASQGRLGQLLRYARSGEVGETRVGYWGSRVANNGIAKLAAMGISFEDRVGGSGRPGTVRVDTSKFDPGARTDAVAIEFAERHGIDPKYVSVDLKSGSKNGVFYIRNPDGGALPDKVSRVATGGAYKDIYRDVKFGRTLSGMMSWSTLKFNGNYSGLHYWKKFGIRTQETAAKFEEKRKAKRAEKKVKAQERASKLRGKISPGAAGAISGVGAAQLGICMAKDIAHETPLLAYENVRGPARNKVAEALTQADQLTAMDDFHITQPGATVKGYKNSEGKSIFQSMPFKALAAGSAGGGTDLPEDLKSGFSPNNTAGDIEKIIDENGGGLLCSTLGQIAGGALGVVAIIAAVPTGGGSVAAYAAVVVGSGVASMAAVTAATTLVPRILDETNPVDKLLEDGGPMQGGLMAFGSVDLANDLFMKGGATMLDDAQVAELEDAARKAEQEELQSKNFFARAFDPNDYRSLTGQMIDNTSIDAQSMANMLGGAFNLQTIGSRLFSSFTPQVQAANEYDFQMAKFGFSLDELNSPLVEDPYANADKVAKLLDDNSGDYIDRAKKCFGVDLTKGSEGWQVDVIKNPDGDPDKELLPNTGKYRGANCDEESDDWLRIRMFIFDSRIMTAYACYDGESEACTQTGLTDESSSNSGEPEPTDNELVSGEAKQLANDILNSGKVNVDAKYASQIKDIAEGKSNCNVNPTILQLIATIAKKHSITISSLNRYCTNTLTASGTGSYHYREGGGHAVDISIVDGQASTGGTQKDLSLLREVLPALPKGSGIGQVNCRGGGSLSLPEGVTEFNDSCNHIHIQVPVKGS